MAIAPSPHAQIDRQLGELRSGATRWSALGAAQKADLLELLRAGTYREAERWAQSSAQAKGIASTPAEGEEWISGPWAVLYALNRYIKTLREIARGGTPAIDPRRAHVRSDGQLVVEVFPETLYDRVLLNGVRAEVRMQCGVTASNLSGSTALWYQEPDHTACVALVLGAGNISSIAPLDVLYMLVAEGAVCALKTNPVNDHLGPILEDAFRPLVDEGYLRFMYGGADVGEYLCAHDLIDRIHITGRSATYNAIVFGPGAEGAARRADNDPRMRKPVTSELGNVSPTIVVPGPWSDADIEFQAQNIVTQKMHNGGFNCIASQVLVLPAQWDKTPKLVAAIEAELRNLADRPAYYPGAQTRRSRLVGAGTNARSFGRESDGFVPRTLLDAAYANSSEAAFHDEAFGSVLVLTQIPGDTEAYLAAAVAFANRELLGTLGANIIAHPKTLRQYASAFDNAVADLHYGCVAVNAWTGVGFLLCETTWGAFPGHTQRDIQSGTGIVHNSHLFAKAEKSVVYGPFAPFPRSLAGYGATLLPKPPWFVTNTMAAQIGRALCAFELKPSVLAMMRVVLLALRG